MTFSTIWAPPRQQNRLTRSSTVRVVREVMTIASCPFNPAQILASSSRVGGSLSTVDLGRAPAGAHLSSCSRQILPLASRSRQVSGSAATWAAWPVSEGETRRICARVHVTLSAATVGPADKAEKEVLSWERTTSPADRKQCQLADKTGALTATRVARCCLSQTLHE